MTTSITDAIATEQYSCEELAVIFATTTLDVKGVQKQFDTMVNNDAVSPDEFNNWCDKVDQEYGKID